MAEEPFQQQPILVVDIGAHMQSSYETRAKEQKKEEDRKREEQEVKMDEMVERLCEQFQSVARDKTEEWFRKFSTEGKAWYSWDDLGMGHMEAEVKQLPEKHMARLQRFTEHNFRLQCSALYVWPFLPQRVQQQRRRGYCCIGLTVCFFLGLAVMSYFLARADA